MSEEASPSSRREVVSPFATAHASLESARPKNKRTVWTVVGIVLVIAVVAAIVGLRYFNDPYRTLEPFPVARYLDNYHSLAGSTFRADLRVEADLGWKEGVGRLMVFGVPSDGRSIVVLIPPSLASIYFTKGQSYLAEVEVRDGGLIYAKSCRKN